MKLEEIKFFGPIIAIDLHFCEEMSQKEIISVMNQIQHCYGFNRKVKKKREENSFLVYFIN